MATKPREGLKQGQSVRVDGIWGTFNYLVGDRWAVVTMDSGQQALVRIVKLNKSAQRRKE